MRVDLAEENRRLRNRVDELEAEIRVARREQEHERVRDLQQRLRRTMGLTSGPARALAALMQAAPRAVRRDVLLDAISLDPDALAPDTKAVDVAVLAIRKALSARGIPATDLRAVRFEGFALAEEAAARIECGPPWAPPIPWRSSQAPTGATRLALLAALEDKVQPLEALRGLPGVSNLHASVSNAKRAGHVTVEGARGRLIVAITADGRAWLVRRRPQGIAA